MTRRRLAVLVTLPFLLCLATLDVRGQQLQTFGWARFEQYLEALRQQAGIPGLAAAVVKDGELVWERGFGFSNVAAAERTRPDTPFHVVGLTQTLSAVLALSCVEQGRLDLDVPVGRFALEFPDPEATLRHVLTHTSDAPYGAAFRHDLARYSALTPAIERCWEGRPFREILTTELLDRYGMIDSVPGHDVVVADTAATLSDEVFDAAHLERYHAIIARLAQPYGSGSATRAPLTVYPANTLDAASGLVTTARDLAQFDAALSAFVPLREETVETMWTPPAPLLQVRPLPFNPPAQPLPHALGWFVQSYRGTRLVWQFGRWPEVTSSIVVKVPGQNLTFILLANSDGLASSAALETGDATTSLFVRLFLRYFL